VIDAPLAFAFGTGMLATVNPCGFAMLPAYLAYFLSADGKGGDKTMRATVGRSLTVGLAVSAGFIAVFSAVGLAVIHLSARVNEWTPWITIVIGVALSVLGVAMVRGYEPVIRLPKLDKGGRDTTFPSMFLFGMSYAIASISCALPLFTGAVAGTFRSADLLSGFAAFVAYALGMTIVLLALTVSMGLARQTIVHGLRKAMPYVSRASGVLLILVGAYLVHYGWVERRVQDGSVEGSGIVDRVTGWSNDVYAWAQDVGYSRLGLLLSLGLAVVLAVTFGLRGARSASSSSSR
jgi:cytochrome c biogenesis protein CcdA